MLYLTYIQVSIKLQAYNLLQVQSLLSHYQRTKVHKSQKYYQVFNSLIESNLYDQILDQQMR